jgi:hypothetical protein
MLRFRNTLLLFAIAALCSSFVESAVFSGSNVDSSNMGGFIFLGKFYYDQGDQQTVYGNAQLTVTLPAGKQPPSSLSLIYFTDSDNDWATYYNMGSCTNIFPNGSTCGTVPCSASSALTFTNGVATVNVPIYGNVRKRPHYFVLYQAGTCGSWGNFDYTLHCTRIDSSWNTELGSDQLGENTLYLVMFFAYIILIGLSLYNMFQIKEKLGFIHPIIKLLSLIIFIAFFADLFSMIHWASYSSNGVGIPALAKTGQITDVFARILMLLLLMLVAKGWTISQYEMTSNERLLIFGVLGAFLVIWVGALFYSYTASPALPATPAGIQFMNILVLLLGIFTAIWFMYTSYTSYSAESSPEKQSLFLRFGLFYGSFLLSIPITAFLAYDVDANSTERVVAIFSTTVNWVAYSVFVAMLWHSWSNKFFEVNTPDVAGDDGVGDFQRL